MESTIDYCYCSTHYFPTAELKDYFSHYPDVYFLEVAFYAELYKLFGKVPLEQFFQTIGVQDKPALLKIDATLSTQQKQAIHHGKYTRDYSLSSQETYDYELEGLDTCLNHITPETSRLLWPFLLTLIEEKAKQDIFTGQYHWFYRRERYHNFDAKFITTLRQAIWLYDNQGKCVKPADIVVAEMAAYETASYAAKVLIEKLEIPAERLTGFTEAQKDRYAKFFS